jgi:flagellar motor protein MotB
MNRAIFSIILCFILIPLFAINDVPSKNLTREETVLLIKEELLFTNDLLNAQNVTTRMIALKQRRLAQRSGEIKIIIDNLRYLAANEEDIDALKIKEMQASLDSIKLDIGDVASQIAGLRKKLDDAEAARLSFAKQITQMTAYIISIVEQDKSPNLPPDILQDMRTNHNILVADAELKKINQAAYDAFLDALNRYGAFLAANGKDQTAMLAFQSEMLAISNALKANQAAYDELLAQFNEYQKSLDLQRETNLKQQRELDALRQYADEQFYKENIYFDSGSVVIKEQYLKVLREFVQSIPAAADYEIQLIGYSDDDPIGKKLAKTYATNWELSVARSAAVAKYLIDNLQIPPQRVVASGKSEYELVITEGIVNKAESRRVKIKLVTKIK